MRAQLTPTHCPVTLSHRLGLLRFWLRSYFGFSSLKHGIISFDNFLPCLCVALDHCRCNKVVLVRASDVSTCPAAQLKGTLVRNGGSHPNSLRLSSQDQHCRTQASGTTCNYRNQPGSPGDWPKATCNTASGRQTREHDLRHSVLPGGRDLACWLWRTGNVRAKGKLLKDRPRSAADWKELHTWSQEASTNISVTFSEPRNL